MLHDDDHKPNQVGTDKAAQPPRQEWLQQNRKAIDHYNKHVENMGSSATAYEVFEPLSALIR
jgi:post-segregation antitoxin (ccd killing protein)